MSSAPTLSRKNNLTVEIEHYFPLLAGCLKESSDTDSFETKITKQFESPSWPRPAKTKSKNLLVSELQLTPRSQSILRQIGDEKRQKE